MPGGQEVAPVLQVECCVSLRPDTRDSRPPVEVISR